MRVTDSSETFVLKKTTWNLTPEDHDLRPTFIFLYSAAVGNNKKYQKARPIANLFEVFPI